MEDIKQGSRDWEDGSVVESASLSSRDPGFSSQQPYASAWLSVAPAPGDPTPSCRHTRRQNVNAHELK